ncbi:hypothetical protein LTR50_002304 [Elasticomyces elasticus]|nr:hypothetical protein LTR50_002304 [Elasticomyces elasticus]
MADNTTSSNKRKRDESSEAASIKAEDHGSNLDVSDLDEADAQDHKDANDEELEGCYDASCEPHPKLAAYDPRLETIRERLERKVADIVELLLGSSSEDRQVTSLLEEAEKISTIGHPAPLKIALLGDTGVGKSSLTNAWLDMPRIARESGAGASCTAVVTEFRRSFDGQTTKLAARIEYFDLDEVRSLLVEHIEDYNTYTFEFDNQWDSDTRDQYRRRATAATETFLALFCKQSQFKNPGAAKATLQKAHTVKTLRLIDRLCVWIEPLLKPKKGVDGSYSVTCEAEETRTLRNMIDPLVSATAHNRGPSLWPLAKKISVGIKDCHILENLTLVDLPGVDDTNEVRVNATHEYLRSCDALWIVARIDRIITNRDLDNMLERYAERFGENLAVVATRSDDINDMSILAHDLRSYGYSLGDYEGLAEKSRALSAKIRGRNTKLSNIGPQNKTARETIILEIAQL